jgi:hypothetical protein
MERAGGFDAGARRVSSGRFRRFHEHLSDAVATVRLVDYQSRDPAPGAAVVRHRHHEVRRGPDERAAVVGDEHIGSRIGEHVFECGTQAICGLRMAQIAEQASEVIDIREPTRANNHCGHPDRIMNAPDEEPLKIQRSPLAAL